MTTVNNIITNIEAIEQSERITKGALATLSRDILTYMGVELSNDIGLVNRLVGALTPMNKAVAIKFFGEFLPFSEKEGVFGKKLKGDKACNKRYDAIATFLSEEGNTIWTWAEVNVEVTKKPKDYQSKIEKLVSKALADDEEGISQEDVLRAVLISGVEIDTVVTLMAEVMAAQQEAA